MRSADIRRAKRRFWLLSVPMKTSEEDDDVDDDDDRFVYWVRGPFTQPPSPPPLISFSPFFPLHTISIYPSLFAVCFLSLLCPSSVGSRPQPLDPLCSRSGRAIFICSVSSVVFLYGPWTLANMPWCCAPSRYNPLPFLSFASVSQSHLITSIQFSLFFLFYFPFLFYLVLSSCCLNWWCREFSGPSVFL